MQYVESTMADDEVLLSEAHFHWTFDLISFLWLIFFGWVLIGVYMAIARTIEQFTTELAVTNRRFVYKKGFIIRKTNEFAINRIESVLLNQGFWGRILNYGRLEIRGSGIGEINLPVIARPLEFRRSLLNASSAADDEDKIVPARVAAEAATHHPGRKKNRRAAE